MIMVFAVGCNKPDEPNNGGNNSNNDSDVRVTTYTPQDITARTVKCGGDVIVIQGLSLTELGVCWSKEQSPTIEQDHLSTSVWNEPFVCTITDLEPDTKYYVRAYALRGLLYYYGDEKCFITESTGGSYEGHEYVDLGLPSGTMWASCNVGAERPEEYGVFFAWGETQPKTSFDWSNYKYSDNTGRLTKYCSIDYCGYQGFTDDLTVLQSEDDAAMANWGHGWMMPTAEQWNELLDYTSDTWTELHGVNGKLFTAMNGNSIFIPAAGQPSITNNGIYGEGNCGYYWSSSLYTELPYSAINYTFSSGTSTVSHYGVGRYGGFSVRPVRSNE